MQVAVEAEIQAHVNRTQSQQYGTEGELHINNPRIFMVHAPQYKGTHVHQTRYVRNSSIVDLKSENAEARPEPHMSLLTKEQSQSGTRTISLPLNLTELLYAWLLQPTC